MKRSSLTLALIAIGLATAAPAHAQAPEDDYNHSLIQTLRLAKAQRLALKRGLTPRDAPFAACVDRVATDARLEADLAPVIARIVPTADRAQPILAFLATPAGRRFSAAVERREPELKPPLLRPLILPGAVPMSANEVSADDLREINAFFGSEQGAPLRAILSETTGFAALGRTLKLQKALAAECGINFR